MNIIVAGGTGFIGRALVRRLAEEGHAVSVLTRNPSAAGSVLPEGARALQWDGKTAGPWVSEVERADAILNFAGEPIADRLWTGARKERLWRSRTEATAALVDAIDRSSRRPRVLVNASGVDYYGDVPEGDVTETDGPSSMFLGRLCNEWETVAGQAGQYGVRVARIRIGLVLGDNGGVLARMVLPFRFFVGGPLGSGRQWVSWIHREDLIGAVLHILGRPDLSGPFNLTTPNPVTMDEFSAGLGDSLRRPSWVRIPPFMLRGLLGELSTVVLSGRRAIPVRLMASGYTFRFPVLRPALEDIVQ